MKPLPAVATQRTAAFVGPGSSSSSGPGSAMIPAGMQFTRNDGVIGSGAIGGSGSGDGDDVNEKIKDARGWPVYSLVMFVVTGGIVIPITGYASAVFGMAVGLIVVCVSLALVYRFISKVRALTMTDWEYVRMPSTLACLDIYFFVCLNWALMWFLLWATDRDGALSPSSAISAVADTSPYLVYLVLLYSVLASFWFSGGGRLYPMSAAAYAWGFFSLLVGAWFVILVCGWVVHVVRRSPSRVNENTLLPVYHTPAPPSMHLHSQQQQQQPPQQRKPVPVPTKRQPPLQPQPQAPSPETELIALLAMQQRQQTQQQAGKTREV